MACFKVESPCFLKRGMSSAQDLAQELGYLVSAIHLGVAVMFLFLLVVVVFLVITVRVCGAGVRASSFWKESAGDCQGVDCGRRCARPAARHTAASGGWARRLQQAAGARCRAPLAGWWCLVLAPVRAQRGEHGCWLGRSKHHVVNCVCVCVCSPSKRERKCAPFV
jgi:hypothetical protein